MKNKLINAVIQNNKNLIYININQDNKYNGWVSNFNFKLPNKEIMKLDLKNEKDLFLLFVLASSWSKTGQWENSALFTTYLKSSNKDDFKLWMDEDFINTEIHNRVLNATNIVNECIGITPRRKVSFRKDYYHSLNVLSNKWEEIKDKLKESEKACDYMIFIDYISQIEGLGSGKNKMKIKIPLILRELRCQDVYKDIPGEICCVTDERVRVCAKELGILLPNITNIGSVFKSSKIIYENFGDLYDIPLFAYDDLKEEL